MKNILTDAKPLKSQTSHLILDDTLKRLSHDFHSNFS